MNNWSSVEGGILIQPFDNFYLFATALLLWQCSAAVWMCNAYICKLFSGTFSLFYVESYMATFDCAVCRK